MEHIPGNIELQAARYAVGNSPGQGAMTRGLSQRAAAVDAMKSRFDPFDESERVCRPLEPRTTGALGFDFGTLRSGTKPLQPRKCPACRDQIGSPGLKPSAASD